MTAIVLGADQIDLLVTAAIQSRICFDGQPVTADRAAPVGTALLATNYAASVSSRHPDIDLTGLPAVWYAHHPVAAVDPRIVLHVVGCYEDHTGQHPGWYTSPAADFCVDLRDAMLTRLNDNNLARQRVEGSAA